MAGSSSLNLQRAQTAHARARTHTHDYKQLNFECLNLDFKQYSLFLSLNNLTHTVSSWWRDHQLFVLLSFTSWMTDWCLVKRSRCRLLTVLRAAATTSSLRPPPLFPHATVKQPCWHTKAGVRGQNPQPSKKKKKKKQIQQKLKMFSRERVEWFEVIINRNS